MTWSLEKQRGQCSDVLLESESFVEVAQRAMKIIHNSPIGVELKIYHLGALEFTLVRSPDGVLMDVEFDSILQHELQHMITNYVTPGRPKKEHTREVVSCRLGHETLKALDYERGEGPVRESRAKCIERLIVEGLKQKGRL